MADIMHQNLLAAVSLIEYLDSKRDPQLNCKYKDKIMKLLNVVRAPMSGASKGDALEADYGYAYMTYQFYTKNTSEIKKAFDVLFSLVNNTQTPKHLFKRAASLLARYYREGLGNGHPNKGAAIGWATLSALMGGKAATGAMDLLADLYQDYSLPNTYNKKMSDYWDDMHAETCGVVKKKAC